MITVFFCAGPVTDYATAKAADTARFARFFQGMLAAGIYLPPSQFEAMFVSLAHDETYIERLAQAARTALQGC